jgi:hypothetical protein
MHGCMLTKRGEGGHVAGLTERYVQHHNRETALDAQI